MKKVNWKAYIISTLIVAIIIFGAIMQEKLFYGSQTQATKGVLDLSNFDLDNIGTIKLNGEWEFYWNELLTSDDFSKVDGEKPTMTGYISTPSFWGGQVGDTKITGKGFATYRLIIKGLEPGEMLGIKKTNIRNSYLAQVNGIEINRNGEPAQSREQYSYGNVPRLSFFQSTSNEIELIVQVANYDHLRGGIVAPIYFGLQSDIIVLNNRWVIFEAGVEAILLTIGIIYLLLFFFVKRYREEDAIIISFGVFCILLALANSLISERSLLLLVPNLPFAISFRLLQISILGSLASIAIFLNQMGEEIMPKVQRNIVIGFYSSLVVLVFILPTNIYSNLTPLINMFGGVFLLGIFMKNLTRFIGKISMNIDRNSHATLILALLGVNIYALDVTLMDLGLKTNMIIGNISILIFVGALIFLLIKRISDVYNTNTQISLELANQEKQSLENENAFLRSQISPHFLYNALNTIISYCYTDGNRAALLLKSFSSYLRGSFDFDSHEKYVLLEKELELVNAYVDIQKARFGDDLKVKMDIKPELLKCNVPPLSIQILIENAIRHGVMKKENGGTVDVHVYVNKDKLVVEVSDDGIGMPEDLIERLNEGKNINESITRQGIGLLNIQKRLINSYGSKLNIESEEGVGTKMSFELGGQSLAFIGYKTTRINEEE
jgi:two-component system, LytTR family, sensor kinase